MSNNAEYGTKPSRAWDWQISPSFADVPVSRGRLSRVFRDQCHETLYGRVIGEQKTQERKGQKKTQNR